MTGELTLAEKAALCLGSDMWHTAAVPRLGIPAVTMSDGPHGLRHGSPATCFPTASALGSSFDPDLLRRVGAAIGREARAQGVDVVLGPGVNIKRSPLCGRNFEYLSEDPRVSGVLGAALVEGIQSQGVGASVKHFAANNQETDRIRVSADVDERTLREIYLDAFERVVTRARPWTVMCSYNKINGTYASEHRWLLTDVLRDQWGFEGVVISDWGAVHDRVAALAAGLDLEMPPNAGVSDVAIVAAVTAGELDEHVVDRSVAHIRGLADLCPLSGADDGNVDADAHHALARAAAADCAVLLKNVDDLLPLRPVAGETIAVIGALARTPVLQGGGSSRVDPTRVDIPLDEIRAAVPDGVQVTYESGFAVEAAVDLASRATTVVTFLGPPPGAESEGYDRTDLDLPADQLALLAGLAEANPRLVVVLANGSVVRTAPWDEHVGAVLECWLSGQAGGGAVADLLFGRVDPGGRLAETVPLRVEDTPAFLNFPGEAGHVRYGEGVFVGYRGYDALDREVGYPFGHGLSYTSFEYSNLRVVSGGTAATDDLAVTIDCEITNTGRRRGKEVVQLYVSDPEASVRRPPRELKGFHKVDLAAGERARVRFRLDARDLSYWSVDKHDWVLEGGEFILAVGASSRDLRLSTSIDVDVAAPEVPLDGTATVRQWLADPAGAAALRDVLGTDADGRLPEPLGTPDALAAVADFPLSTFAVLAPGTGLTHAVVQQLADRLAVS